MINALIGLIIAVVLFGCFISAGFGLSLGWHFAKAVLEAHHD